MVILRIFGSRDCTSQRLLLCALGDTYGLTMLPPLERSELGKPYFPTRPEIHFSLSHSGKLLLCAVGDRPLGVDIELIKPRNVRLPAYALTKAEQEDYHALGSDWPAFYTLWCRKEAWCKYTGRGLGRSFQETPPEDRLFYGAYEGPGWRAALCGEEPAPEGILWLNPKNGDPCDGET